MAGTKRFDRVPGEYKRPKGEYTRQRALLDLSALGDSDEFTVVGPIEFDERMPDIGADDVLVELVPEPGNPWDSTAICVEIDQTRIGYMSSGLATFFHRMFADLNASGISVVSRASVEADGSLGDFKNTSVAFPGFALSNVHDEWSGIDAAVQALYACLSVEEQTRFLDTQAGFSFGETMDDSELQAVRRVEELGRLFCPTLFPATKGSSAEVPGSLPSHFAAILRFMSGHEIITRYRRERAQREVKSHFVRKLVDLGSTQSDAGRSVGVSTSTVARYLKEARGEMEAPRDKEHKLFNRPDTSSLKCLLLRETERLIGKSGSRELWPLHRTEVDGMSYVESCDIAATLSSIQVPVGRIASILHCEVDEVSAMASDFRFYISPATDPERLRDAESFRYSHRSLSMNPTLSNRPVSETVRVIRDTLSLEVLRSRSTDFSLTAMATELDKKVRVAAEG